MVHCTVLPAGTQGGEALRVMRIVWHRRTRIKNLQSLHRGCPIWEPATHSHNGERNESACSSHFAGNCKKRKNPAANRRLAARKLKTFWKQQEKVENSTEKLQNGAAEAGKLTPSRPTKKPNRLKMVGHLYKTHLENRSSTSLVLCDTTKTRASDILYVTGSCLYVTKKISIKMFWCKLFCEIEEAESYKEQKITD